MIEHARTKGFKGFDLDEAVPNKVIYCGKNKSGKSSRADAIAIAIYGYIPFSDVGKKPGNILDSFGEESLVTAIKIGKHEFARKISSNGKGGVSQVMQIGGKKVASDNFAIMLNKAGAPRIANVAEFMKHSEAKKVDTLFELFPNDELAGIDTEIEEAKADVSRLEKKKSWAEGVVKSLTNSKQAIQLPPGSIAEIKSEIEEADTRITDYEDQIKKAEIEEAEERAATKAKEDLLAEQEKERVANLKKPVEKNQSSESSFYGGSETIYPATNQNNPSLIDKVEKGIEITVPINPEIELNPIDSIERIIGALTGSGCGTCAALIVAKQELKKYKAVS